MDDREMIEWFIRMGYIVDRLGPTPTRPVRVVRYELRDGAVPKDEQEYDCFATLEDAYKEFSGA